MNKIEPNWHVDPIQCLCKGQGWGECEVQDLDTYVACPVHYIGQLMPDEVRLLLDEPEKLADAEFRSLIKYKIEQTKSVIDLLNKQLKTEQEKLVKMEHQLVCHTPTVRQMPAVKLNGDFI